MKKAIALFFLTCLCALPISIWAQSLQISGRVLSKSSGNPLVSASVRIKGTKEGAVTDANGNFTIKAKKGQVLVVSYLNTDPQEFKVGDDLSPQIVLEEKIGNLEDVVVVGYGTQKKSVVTGAISSVKASDLENMPVSRVDDALEGRTSGVVIATNTGAPGAGATIFIRGITSINQGANTPLYVVDGNIVDAGGIDYLNPADIESVEVLKDAASTAIYGARGGPGVILVTTKKGKSGTARISYTGSYGIASPARKLNLLNATQYATLRNESVEAANAQNNTNNALPFADPQSLGKGTDWQSTIFDNHAKVQNHEIAISGGSDKGVYYTSFGFYDQQGIVAPSISNYKRFTARVNTESHVRPWLSVGENFGYSYIKSQGGLNTNSEFGGPLSSAINLDPTTPTVITDPAVLATYPYSVPAGTAAVPLLYDAQGRPYAVSDYITQEITNPLAYIQTQQGNFGWSHNLVGNAYLEVGPIKGFRFRSSLNAKQAFYGSTSFTPLYYLNSSTKNLINNSFYKDDDQSLIWNFDNTLSYTNSFGDHHLMILIGTSSEKDGGANDVNTSYLGLPVNTFGQASTNYSIPQVDILGGGYEGQTVTRSSYIGRLTYNYAEKYLLTANFRRDGSSNFGSNNKYGNFPAVSVGWVPTKETFWSPSSVVNSLKIRGGYGINGNDAAPPYAYESTISGGRNYAYGSGGEVAIGYSPNAPANPDLKWERVSQLDLGFDAILFKHFTATFDYFDKKTSGMLLAVQIPGYSGATGNPTGNVASMYNKGEELELGYNQHIGKVGLTLTGNISHLNNRVTNLGTNSFFKAASFQASSYEISRIQPGQPVDAFYGFKTLGIFQTQAQVNSYVGKGGQLIQPNAKPGDFKFADLDGDGAITSSDRTFLGNPTPDWTFGFTASAYYKNFDLTVFAQGVSGNQIYQGYRRLDITNSNYMSTELGRWTGPGTSNTIPRLIDGDPNGNYSNPTSLYLQSGSYLKLRSLRLGYTLPKVVSDKAGFQKIYVYVAGDNLVTLTKYNGFDPEVGGNIGLSSGNANNYGVDNGVYPSARSFTVGLNVGF